MIFNIRLSILIFLIFIILIGVFSFVVRVSPVKKLMTLAFLYNSVLIYLIYEIKLNKIESEIFSLVTSCFITFLLTMITGIGIVNNLLRRDND